MLAPESFLLKDHGELGIVRGQERKVFGYSIASAVVETPGLKGSWREAEDWHYGTKLESLKRTQERPLVKVQPQLQWRPQHSRDSRTVAIFFINE